MLLKIFLFFLLDFEKISFFPLSFFGTKRGRNFSKLTLLVLLDILLILVEDVLNSSKILYAMLSMKFFTCCVGSNVLNSLKILYIMLSMKISSCCAGATNQFMFVKFWWQVLQYLDCEDEYVCTLYGSGLRLTYAHLFCKGFCLKIVEWGDCKHICVLAIPSQNSHYVSSSSITPNSPLHYCFCQIVRD